MRKLLKYLILLIVPIALLFDGSTVSAIQNIVEVVNHVLPIIDIAAYAPMADGNITYEELAKEVQENKDYATLDFKTWDSLITQRGINHIDDKLLEDYVQNVPAEMTATYIRLQDSYDKNPTPSQVTQINTAVAKLEAQKAPLTVSLLSLKAALLEKKPTPYSEEFGTYTRGGK